MNDPPLVLHNTYDMAIGNPMKGVCTNPDNQRLQVLNHTKLPGTIVIYKLPMNLFMLADPDTFPYPDDAFN